MPYLPPNSSNNASIVSLQLGSSFVPRRNSSWGTFAWVERAIKSIVGKYQVKQQGRKDLLVRIISLFKREIVGTA
jgi:hypothetical protein